MIAVILCAGRGTRLQPFTHSHPKSLIPINGKPLIEYTLDILSSFTTGIVMVIGYHGDQIKKKYGDSYNGCPLYYVVQEEMLGTGHALLCAKPVLDDLHSPDDSFLVFNGDDLYHKDDVAKIAQIDCGCLAKKVENPSSFGVFVVDEHNVIQKLVEKPAEFVSDLANVGVYKFPFSIFEYELELSERGEYEIVDYVNYLVSQKKNPLALALDHYWLPVNSLEQKEVAEDYLEKIKE